MNPLTPLPTLPADAQAVISERQAAGRPLLTPVIQFLNKDRTLCYSNAGTNFLLSSPKLVEFLLGLPPGGGLLRMFRGLALTRPTQVSITRNFDTIYSLQARSTRAIRQRVVKAVPAAADFRSEGVQHDPHEWVVTLREAVGSLLPAGLGDEWSRLTDIGVRLEDRCLGPGCLNVIDSEETHSCLSLSVVDSVTGDNIATVEAAIAHALRDEEIPRTCGDCHTEGFRRTKSLSVLPRVKYF